MNLKTQRPGAGIQFKSFLSPLPGPKPGARDVGHVQGLAVGMDSEVVRADEIKPVVGGWALRRDFPGALVKFGGV